jgi:hypothetical protein
MVSYPKRGRALSPVPLAGLSAKFNQIPQFQLATVPAGSVDLAILRGPTIGSSAGPPSNEKKEHEVVVATESSKFAFFRDHHNMSMIGRR